MRYGWSLLALSLVGCVDDFPAVEQVGLDDARVMRPDGASPDGARPDMLLDAAPPDMRIDMAADATLPPDMAPDLSPPDLGPPDMAADLPCMPVDETCNGRDDDCNGVVDDVAGIGDPCTVGQGACEQAGSLICNPEAEALECDALAGEEFAERCNAIDDDCDGQIDEGLGLGEACFAGVGACATAGTNVCAADGEVACDATPGAPGEETCNAVDDDCDGQADEGFDVGGACSAGVGVCEQVGAIVCLDDKAICDAVPGEPADDEACNGLDDDCDGDVDEQTGLGYACSVGVGQCIAAGSLICDDVGGTICDAVPGEPVDERCNDLDDDCDGEADEGLGVGDRCTVGVGECARDGRIACSADQALCDATPRDPSPEACDDLDNDCDGLIDEGDACGDYVVERCAVWLGWRDNYYDANLGPVDTWGDCPDDSDDTSGDSRCNSTRGDEDYRSVPLSGGMDFNDLFALRFVCRGGDNAMSAWVQSSCRLALAYGDRAEPADLEGLNPAACAAAWRAEGVAPRGCVQTGADGRFHPVQHVGSVDANDAWAVAFRCDNADVPERAAGIQASVAMHFALQDRGEAFGACVRRRIDDTPVWRRSDNAGCPDRGSDSEGNETCASTSGDGQFHGFKSGDNGQLGGCWSAGVSLRRLR